MKKPPTLAQITLAKDGENIHTFSNGSEWEFWACANCFECRYYELEGEAGEFCGFEAAAMLHAVTPEVAALFGWRQRTTEYGPRSGWEAPQTCAFFREPPDPNVDPDSEPTPTCPETLNLFTDQRTTDTMPLPPSTEARRRAKVTP